MQVLAEQNRTFGYAAAASVAVHALLLLTNLPATRETLAPPPEPPLVARLVEPEPAPAPPPAEPKEKEEPRVEKPKPPPKKKPPPKPRPRPAPRASAPSAPPMPVIPEQKEESPKEEIATDAKPEESAPPPAAPAPAPPPPVAAIAPPAAAPAPDPALALAGFRQQLVELAARYKRYPLVARDNGWTGDVVVRVEVAASGEVASIRVKTSSGYDVLDEQALEMFRKAVPAVRVPPALRGQDFSVEVRAIYNLQDRPG